MSIIWREKMSVDGGVIDQDHKHLIDIINRFETVSADGLNSAEALEILYALKFYASTHFEREENIQRLAAYPYVDAHKREHEELQKRLVDLIGDTCGGTKFLSPETAREVADFLHHWLVDHILESDLRMKTFVDALKQSDIKMAALKDLNYVS